MDGESLEYHAPGTFGSKKNDPKVSFADVHYNRINSMANLRERDMDSFRKSVTSFEITLAGDVDDLYQRDMLLINNVRKQIQVNNSSAAADVYYYDEKAKALVSLARRVHKGIKRIRQNILDSDLVKGIAKELLGGIGQNIFFTGKPGIGKSHASMDLVLNVLALTGQTFVTKIHMTFTPHQFTKVYNDLDKCPPGSAVIIDEIGVNFNSKNALSKANKVFSKLMQIIRRRALLVVFNAPDLGFMDKDGRKMLHFWFEGVRLDKNLGHAYFKPHVVQVVQSKGDILYPFPVYDGDKLSMVEFNRIPDEISVVYESLSKVYKDELAVEVEEEMAVLANGKKKVVNPLYEKFRLLRLEGKRIKDILDLDIGITTRTATNYEKKRLIEIETGKVDS